MNDIKTLSNRFVTRREAVLRQIAHIGPFIEGTLVKLPRKDCRHVAHRLTARLYAPQSEATDDNLAKPTHHLVRPSRWPSALSAAASPTAPGPPTVIF